MPTNHRVPYFTRYEDAKVYAQALADRCRTPDRTRYVALAWANRWAVGTKKQLEDLGLGPLVPLYSRQNVRMKQEEQAQIFAYWNQCGNIKKTATKFGVSYGKVYHIVRLMRNKK
nr:late transcriptional activator [Klebsiella phage vB_Kpn_K9PH25C2]